MGSIVEIISKEEQIQNYIVGNLFEIQQLVKPYRLQRDALLTQEQGIWHLDVQSQYRKIIKSVIAVNLAQALQITPLDALLAVEELRVDDL